MFLGVCLTDLRSQFFHHLLPKICDQFLEGMSSEDFGGKP